MGCLAYVSLPCALDDQVRLADLPALIIRLCPPFPHLFGHFRRCRPSCTSGSQLLGLALPLRRSVRKPARLDHRPRPESRRNIRLANLPLVPPPVWVPLDGHSCLSQTLEMMLASHRRSSARRLGLPSSVSRRLDCFATFGRCFDPSRCASESHRVFSFIFAVTRTLYCDRYDPQLSPIGTSINVSSLSFLPILRYDSYDRSRHSTRAAVSQ